MTTTQQSAPRYTFHSFIMHKNACYLLATANPAGRDMLFAGRLNAVSRIASNGNLDCRIQLIGRLSVVLASVDEIINSTFSTSQSALTSASVVIPTSNATGRACVVVP